MTDEEDMPAQEKSQTERTVYEDTVKYTHNSTQIFDTIPIRLCAITKFYLFSERYNHAGDGRGSRLAISCKKKKRQHQKI